MSPASSACEPLTSSCRRRGFSRTSRVSRWSQPPAPAGCGCPARRTHPSWMMTRCRRAPSPHPSCGCAALPNQDQQHVYGFLCSTQHPRATVRIRCLELCADARHCCTALWTPPLHTSICHMQCVCPSACAPQLQPAIRALCGLCILFLCVVVKSIIKCLQLHAGTRQACSDTALSACR